MPSKYPMVPKPVPAASQNRCRVGSMATRGTTSKWTGICLLVTLSFASSGAATSAANAAEPASITVSIPQPTGPNAVGTRALEFVDRSRPMGFGLDGPRRLMVQLTYPIAHQAKCPPAPYAPTGIVQRFQEQLDVAPTLHVDSGLCAGGKIENGAHPLVIFSHGYTADRFLYTALTGDLASRGFIVASVDHTGDAFAVQFPHAGYIDGEFGGPVTQRQLTGEELQALVDVRAADVSFVLSRMRKLGASSKGLLAGHLGTSVGVFGHSLGGATASQVAVVDKRFDAVANLEGEIWGGPAKTARATMPYLLALAGAGPIWQAFSSLNICDFYAASSGPKYAWVLADALHNSFTDAQALAREIAREDPGWSYASSYQSFVGTIDPATSIDSQRRALGAFFTAYLERGKKPTMLTPPGSFSSAPPDRLTCSS
jgi:dienelactone hydrolase